MFTVISPFRSPRLEYALDFVFGEFLRIPHALKTEGESIDAESFVVAYGIDLPGGACGIRVPDVGLCAERGLRQSLPEVGDRDGLPLVFAEEGDSMFECDVFSLAFFVLSRYEEYLIRNRDEHGRFSSEQSRFSTYLDKPYLDLWLLRFENRLRKMGAPVSAQPRPLRWNNTVDVDIAYAFRGRGVVRRWGSAVKDLAAGDWKRLKLRRKVLGGHADDPYDTYAYISEVAADADQNHVFMLVGERSGYDINLDLSNELMQDLARRLKTTFTVGLHPSYKSLEEPERIGAELALLEETLGEKVKASRQHFLRFALPHTFAHLAKAGIERDYSMGYHDRIGFRSGTGFPHDFYDPVSDTRPGIRLVPLHAMDSAMKVYSGLRPSEALDAMIALYESQRATGGLFTTVWHNHSLSDFGEWAGWKAVFEGFADHVRETRING